MDTSPELHALYTAVIKWLVGVIGTISAALVAAILYVWSAMMKRLNKHDERLNDMESDRVRPCDLAETEERVVRTIDTLRRDLVERISFAVDLIRGRRD